MNREQKLARILEGWLEGHPRDEESKDFLRDLEQDSSLREEFASQVAMLGALKATKEPEPRWLALFDLLETNGTEGTAQDNLEEKTMARISKISDVPWHRRFPIIQAAAAILLLGLAWLFFQNRTDPETGVVTTEKITVSPQPIAIVLGLQSEGSSQGTGDYLQPGQIAQSEGWLSIQTMNGVSITLNAPFDVNLISHKEIYVARGNIRVQVPPGAEGFRMSSNIFEIIDRGTEFAVEVKPDGAGRCRVFEGKADIKLINSSGPASRTRWLEAGDSAKIDPDFQQVSLFKEDDDAYPEMKLPLRATLALADSYPADVMRMRPKHYWRFESSDDGLIANEVNEARPLNAKGSAQIDSEAGGNHSAKLTQAKGPGYFALAGVQPDLLNHDFTIGFFAQFDWLQNFAMVSVQQYDSQQKGHAFLLQAFAAFKKSGLQGTGLHAAFRDPPGWIGGTEIYGSSLLRPNYWHHVAIVRNAEEATLFLDGSPVGTKWIGNMTLDFRNLYIGRLNGNLDQSPEFSRGMVGHLDEMAVFPHALTEAEIKVLSGVQKNGR